jgi:hypothetical protein
LEGLWELVAQLVEQRTFNAWVLGSIPSELTTPQAANPLKQPQVPLGIAVSGLPGWKPLAVFWAQKNRLQNRQAV